MRSGVWSLGDYKILIAKNLRKRFLSVFDKFSETASMVAAMKFENFKF